MVALRSQGNWRWEGPLGTPLGLAQTPAGSPLSFVGTSRSSNHPAKSLGVLLTPPLV